jgi:hypothetical protein
MNHTLRDDIADIIATPSYLPCISLLMPFEPKMGLQKELDHKLKTMADQIERDLTLNYPPEKVAVVIQKLRQVISGLNYDTHKKSIAIFVSPLMEKTYYLDLPIEEKIIIDESFEIRDLIYSKKEIHKYLLVVLSAHRIRTFLGNTVHFIRLTLNVSENIEAYTNDISEKVANFSDENKRKEILLDKFLRHADHGLQWLLQSYKLPLFVMGTTKTIGHFKSISKNLKQVIDFIPGNYEEKSEHELQELMQPYLRDWQQIKYRKLLAQLDDSMSMKRLAVGIEEVWKAATLKRGRLLVVEKNYVIPAAHSDLPEVIYKREVGDKQPFYIKDAVDDVMEKVLASGGDVEFVDEGVLQDYKKIALIEYYS